MVNDVVSEVVYRQGYNKGTSLRPLRSLRSFPDLENTFMYLILGGLQVNF